VVQPLKDLYGQRFEVAPYPVLFKPSHGLKILRREENAGFSPKAAYIFTKQLEEADAIVLNRIDELTPVQVQELAFLFGERFPGVPLVRMSAKTGAGLEALTTLLDQQGQFGRKILDIDYDTYAEGEAELGWLNSNVHVHAEKPFSVDNLLLAVLGELQLCLGDHEVAHLKAIGLTEGTFAVGNLVASDVQPELSLPSRVQANDLNLIINARVAMDPTILDEAVRNAVAKACQSCGAQSAFGKTQSFRPGRPTPTHRYASAY
jgi:hypothetical protein